MQRSPLQQQQRVFDFSSPVEMHRGSSSYASGATRRPVEFGRSYVVRPKGRHQATIVWLHGLGDNGASCSHLVETLPLPNIKWICPTAPTRPVAMFGGFACTAWFDIGEISEDGADDVDGMDASAAHIANLLSSEPPDVKLGIGGFSMGAAAALYSATCFTHGKYGNGSVYPINLSAVVGLSGWLPCSRSLRTKVDSSQDAARRAASLPLLVCHGRGDGVVPYAHGERSAETRTLHDTRRDGCRVQVAHGEAAARCVSLMNGETLLSKCRTCFGIFVQVACGGRMIPLKATIVIACVLCRLVWQQLVGV
ncbi:acyl-protein thioesterase [Musa troglodytarum]|uniref:Acyl-protein thioesterase n=1 Tax=Musa troglodytarum TaxID=320322 RepID=A0A9E7K7L4_9LILI|nr:acyl-protein thioesterase [Musa troglodytarum]